MQFYTHLFYESVIYTVHPKLTKMLKLFIFFLFYLIKFLLIQYKLIFYTVSRDISHNLEVIILIPIFPLVLLYIRSIPSC